MANLFHLTLSAALCASLALAAPRDLTVSWNRNAAKPVNVTLYYETLCPYCSRFMQNQLFPVWEKVKDDDLMSVELRPYGNAHESFEGGEWKFECQHGVRECQGNMLETCIIHYYSEPNKQREIIKCVEKDFYSSQGADWEKTLQNCASTGVDVEKVSKCAKGKEGNNLMHQMAIKTGPHTEVPWIIIDGKHDDAAEHNLLNQICKAYKGTPPAVCST